MNNGKINIAHIIGTNFFGGPEKQILEHLTRMDLERYNPMLISFVEKGLLNKLLKKAERNNIPFSPIYTENPFNPRAILDLIKILRKYKTHILCSHGYKANIIGRVASWKVGIPMIYISRGWTSESFKIKVFDTLDRFFIPFADRIVAVSQGQYDKLLKLKLKREKLRLIYNGININGFGDRDFPSIRDQYGIKADDVLIISAGRLSPEKNYAALIQAAKRCFTKVDNIQFIIFGDGFLRDELEEELNQAGLQEKFLLPGFVENVSGIFNQADIFVLPSFTEGLSNVLLESYSRNIPAVASAVGGNPEVVLHNKTGFLFDPKDIESLTENILTLANDRSLRMEMGQKGFEHVRNNFSFEEQTRKYDNLYREVLESSKES